MSLYGEEESISLGLSEKSPSLKTQPHTVILLYQPLQVPLPWQPPNPEPDGEGTSPSRYHGDVD